jgi:hypothetical protein
MLDFALFDESCDIEMSIEMLCERVILARRGSTEATQRKPEPAIDACLPKMLHKRIALDGAHRHVLALSLLALGEEVLFICG